MSDPTFQVIALFEDVTKPWTLKPDWDRTVQIIDIVNENPHKATNLLAPRILQQLTDKDAKVVWLTLIILDACMKHCPQHFVTRIASGDFMTTLTKIVKKRWMKKKKAFKPEAMFKNWCGQLAAAMIRDWGVAFSKRSERSNYPIFYQTYQACIAMGVTFPPVSGRDNMPRFEGKPHHPKHEETKPKTGGDILRNSLRDHRSAAIPGDVKKEVDASSNALSLLEDILKNISKDEKIENNDVATQVVQELKTHFDNISKLVPANLDNEKACASLLTVHDKIATVLKKYDQAKSGGAKVEESETSEEESDEAPHPVKDIDENTFHQNYVAPLVQNNPFSNFWVSQAAPPASPFSSSPAVTGGGVTPTHAVAPFAGITPVVNPFAQAPAVNPFTTNTPNPFVATQPQPGGVFGSPSPQVFGTPNVSQQHLPPMFGGNPQPQQQPFSSPQPSATYTQSPFGSPLPQRQQPQQSVFGQNQQPALSAQFGNLSFNTNPVNPPQPLLGPIQPQPGTFGGTSTVNPFL